MLSLEKLTYIQELWYEQPHGCTGGDIWHEGEANFICPKCGVRNRPQFHPDWDFLEDNSFSLIREKFKKEEKGYSK